MKTKASRVLAFLCVMGSVFCKSCSLCGDAFTRYQIEISLFISHDTENLPLPISGIGHYVMVAWRVANDVLYPEYS